MICRPCLCLLAQTGENGRVSESMYYGPESEVGWRTVARVPELTYEGLFWLSRLSVEYIYIGVIFGRSMNGPSIFFVSRSLLSFSGNTG